MAIKTEIKNSKKEKSKIRKCFDKFMVTATTLAILSCGGTETNGPEENENVSMFTGEVKEYIDQNNFTELNIYTEDFKFLYDGKARPELSPFKDLFIEICSQNYTPVDTLYGEAGKLNFNESQIKEVVFTMFSSQMGLTYFILNRNEELSYQYSGFNLINGTYFEKFKWMEEDMDWVKNGIIKMSHRDFTGFRYLGDHSLLEENPQYFLNCNYAYDSSLEKPMAILRAVLVPKKILDKKIEDNGLSKELFYERVEAN